jgi:hypothetical protein
MANMLFANNCNTTLSSSLTSGATSMSVTSATGFPSPTGVQYFYCTLADAATQTTIEIVKVTSVTGTTFAITRAQDGTSATAFAAGAVVSLRLVRASLNDFPKLDETNTFNADQSISGALTVSAGLVSTSTFTATPPSDGLVMDYATGFGRFSAFAGDGFQWYNAGVATTKLMQLSSSGEITTATWNGATVGVAYGGTGLTTLTAGYIPYGNGTSAFSSSSNLYFSGTQLGIGVTSPHSLLSVTTGTFGANSNTVGCSFSIDATGLSQPISGLRYTGGSTGISGITYASQWVTDSANSSATELYTSGATPLIFGTSATERGRFDTSGNLLVGTTTSLAKLTIVNGNVVQYTAAWRNDNSGTNYFHSFNYNGSEIGSIKGNNTVTSYNVNSDRRLKENIVPFTSGLETISALKPSQYNYISDKNTIYQGFIADELQSVVPHSVTGEANAVDVDGNPVYQGVDVSFLVPHLVSAIQELNNKFDAYVASHQ